jgi:hypothetical protein
MRNSRNANIIFAAGVIIGASIMLPAVSFWFLKGFIAMFALILVGYFVFKMLEI